MARHESSSRAGSLRFHRSNWPAYAISIWPPATPRLDLSAVTFADNDGVTLVRDLVRQGCALGECAGLVRALVSDDSLQLQRSSAAIEEAQLLAQLRSGDGDAFELVVQRYGGRMLATARRFLNNEHDAEDAVQEAFASAFRALDRFNGEALLSTWLHRIVVNAALVQLRSKRRRGDNQLKICCRALTRKARGSTSR